MERLIFIDLETGGPDPKRHPIIQIGAVVVDDQLQPIEAFEAKIRFDKQKANAYSLRNHYHPGIWAREARDGKEVAQEFAQFLRRHATYPRVSSQGRSFTVAQLVAHNATFDGQFLYAWFDKLGVYLPARRLMLCTMQLAMWHFVLNRARPPTNFQLATLCQQFGVPFHAAAAHDALGDVIATAQLFRAIVRSTPLLRAVAA
jgi:DNA polymerase III epsilon subunit-like protein